MAVVLLPLPLAKPSFLSNNKKDGGVKGLDNAASLLVLPACPSPAPPTGRKADAITAAATWLTALRSMALQTPRPYPHPLPAPPPPPTSTSVFPPTHPPTSPPSSSTHTTEGLSPHPPFSAAARKSGKASRSSLRWRIPSTRTHLQHTQQERLTARQAMHQGLVKSEVEDPPVPTCNTWTGVSREVTGEGSASRSCGTCKQGPKTSQLPQGFKAQATVPSGRAQGVRIGAAIQTPSPPQPATCPPYTLTGFVAPAPTPTLRARPSAAAAPRRHRRC